MTNTNDADDDLVNQYKHLIEQTVEGFYRMGTEFPIDIAAPLTEQIDLMYQHMVVTDCNCFFAKMYGEEEAESMNGKRLIDLHGGQSNPQNRLALRSFIRNSYKVIDVETCEENGNGNRIYLLNNAVGILRNDHLVGFWGTQKNITDSRLANQKYQVLKAQMLHSQMLENLGMLARTIVHDFNNSLTRILMASDMLARDIPLESSARKYTTMIQDAVERASGSCSRINRYSQSTKQYAKPIDLTELVEKSLQPFVDELKCGNVQYDLGSGLPAVFADPIQLCKASFQLIKNAVESLCDDQGSVVVKTGATNNGDVVFIEVTDDGCGISEESMPHLFEPFFTTKIGQPEAGLGLSIVQGIVKSHYGMVEVESATGNGTTIRMVLPASIMPAEEIFGEQTTNAERGIDRLALVIDNQDDFGAIGKLDLESLGFEVLSAPNVDVATKMYRQRPEEFGLVLIDFCSPSSSHFEFLELVNRVSSKTPVVASIPEGENWSRLPSPAAGTALLPKPFMATELIDLIIELCEKAK